MTSAPAGLVAGLDVLQRSLDLTCAALRSVEPAHLVRPTPCAAWTVADLLAHMEDALDAFAEAASGAVGLAAAPTSPLAGRVHRISAKATGLLGRWLAAGPGPVDVAGRPMEVEDVARVAALEIALHGWDLGRATGLAAPVPRPLALALWPVARAVVQAEDGRFAPPRPVPATAEAGERLLALTGRDPAWGPEGPRRGGRGSGAGSS